MRNALGREEGEGGEGRKRGKEGGERGVEQGGGGEKGEREGRNEVRRREKGGGEREERGKRGNKTGVYPHRDQKFNKLHMNLYISCHREWFGSRNNTQASFLTLNGISHC